MSKSFELAAPHLSKADTERVFVNNKGCVWVNNDEEQMAEYFASKGEAYEVFHKSGPKPEASEKTEAPKPEAPTKQRRKKN